MSAGCTAFSSSRSALSLATASITLSCVRHAGMSCSRGVQAHRGTQGAARRKRQQANLPRTFAAPDFFRVLTSSPCWAMLARRASISSTVGCFTPSAAAADMVTRRVDAGELGTGRCCKHGLAGRMPGSQTLGSALARGLMRAMQGDASMLGWEAGRGFKSARDWSVRVDRGTRAALAGWALLPGNDKIHTKIDSLQPHISLHGPQSAGTPTC